MITYEKLLSYVPDIYKKENNLKILKNMSLAFDEFYKILNSIDKMWLIDSATHEYLEIIGGNIKVYRSQDQDWEIYRRKIKMAMYNLYFVPLLNNFIEFVEEITGYYAENIKEGWNVAPNFESGVLNVDLVAPADAIKELLADIEQTYSAGVKVNFKNYVEMYAIYDGIGDFSNVGVEDVSAEDERQLLPLENTRKYKKIYEGIGEINNMGIEDLQI